MEQSPIHPGEVLRRKLKEKGWTQDDLALVSGRSIKAINGFICGKTSVTPELAAVLGAALNEDAHEWMAYDAAYKLACDGTDVTAIQKRARLFTHAPVREMEKRGWIKETKTSQELSSELEAFFERGKPVSSVSLRHPHQLPDLTPAESAWCHRARALARTLIVKPFASARLAKVRSSLKQLASHPKECRHIADLLSTAGVRFLVIEPLPAVRIDGATFWDEYGPVIALSMRYDRIDWFWFTLMHEWSHVEHQDPVSVDTNLIGEGRESHDSEVEIRANREAASSLIASDEMSSFIRRVGPLYSKVRIIQFANRIRIHPGIIVGQLQHAEEIGYSALREFLVKVRGIVTSTTLTDGWGQLISPSHSKGKDLK